MGFGPAALRSRIFARRHSVLLGAIIASFAVRPLLGEGKDTLIVFSLAMLLLLLVALFTLQLDDLESERLLRHRQNRRRTIIAWTLAVPAIAERLLMIVSPSPSLILAGSISWLLIFAFVTWSFLRSVLQKKEVTGETISMSMSVYLLFGITWGLMYVVIYHSHPEAFSFGTTPPPDPQHMFAILIYFSLTTLSTIGFGDITPVSLGARYAAVAEGIAGQFYLAILVARLVGMHMARSMRRE